jgi:hypothetical protein
MLSKYLFFILTILKVAFKMVKEEKSKILSRRTTVREVPALPWRRAPSYAFVAAFGPYPVDCLVKALLLLVLLIRQKRPLATGPA